MTSVINRRDLLRGTGAAAASGAVGIALSGCGSFTRLVTQPAIPERLDVQLAGSTDPVLRVLNRTAFGPRPGDVSRVRQQGIDAYLEEQLKPGRGIRHGPDWLPVTLPDAPAVDFRLRLLDTLRMSEGDLLDIPKKQVQDELQQASVIRAVYSRWQLREVMVEFWNDHFNISQTKGDSPFYKTAYDADAIRAHSLGRFRDLLGATARSPAMLYYLDNARSDKRVPNENYARELMELHTLGVDGGYSQDDVVQVAGCFTGWSIKDRLWRGRFEYRPQLHKEGDKRVLGKIVKGRTGEQGVREGEDVLDLLALHPSTAGYLSWKLCRRFVADEPPPALVARVAAEYTRSGGHITPTLRKLFASQEFRSGKGAKMKRPFDLVIASLRALNANTDGKGPLRHLGRMGQLPFQWAMPNGYPDVASAWSSSLLARWNFALALATGGIPGTSVDLRAIASATGVRDAVDGPGSDVSARRVVDAFSSVILGRRLEAGHARHLAGVVLAAKPGDRLPQVVAGILAAPEHQWR